MLKQCKCVKVGYEFDFRNNQALILWGQYINPDGSIILHFIYHHFDNNIYLYGSDLENEYVRMSKMEKKDFFSVFKKEFNINIKENNLFFE